MRELEERTPGTVAERQALLFAVFALNHAGCGDNVLEVRIGERCILGWCPACAAVGVFVSARA